MIHLFAVAEDLKVVGHTSREVSSKLMEQYIQSCTRTYSTVKNWHSK